MEKLLFSFSSLLLLEAILNSQELANPVQLNNDIWFLKVAVVLLRHRVYELIVDLNVNTGNCLYDAWILYNFFNYLLSSH